MLLQPLQVFFFSTKIKSTGGFFRNSSGLMIFLNSPQPKKKVLNDFFFFVPIPALSTGRHHNSRGQ